ncbi:hypothetical protein MPTK1_5g12705 [Marchantia polymorpha subsp. ruderalis]
MVSTRTFCLVLALMLVATHYQVAIEALPPPPPQMNGMVECACKGTFCGSNRCLCDQNCYCKCS